MPIGNFKAVSVTIILDLNSQTVLDRIAMALFKFLQRFFGLLEPQFGGLLLFFLAPLLLVGCVGSQARLSAESGSSAGVYPGHRPCSPTGRQRQEK